MGDMELVNDDYVETPVHVEIEGLEITGGKIDDSLLAARFFSGGICGFVCDVALRDNVIRGNMGLQMYGGGVYLMCPAVLERNVIIDNHAQVGGGVNIEGTENTPITVTLTENRIENNWASAGGGGLNLSYADVHLVGNTIAGNQVEMRDGGGVAIQYGQGVVVDNIIVNNRTGSGQWFNGGGGLYVANTEKLVLQRNTLAGNYAVGSGGGLYSVNNALVMQSNILRGNHAECNGGGLAISSNIAALTSNRIEANTAEYGGGISMGEGQLTLSRDIIRDNVAQTGGGMGLYNSQVGGTNTALVANRAEQDGNALYMQGSSARLVHATVNGADSDLGSESGLYVSESSQVRMVNTLLVNHRVGVTVTQSSSANLNHVLLYGNLQDVGDSTGNIVVTNPLSGDPALSADGYHLTLGSAAMDANASLDTGLATDIDGDARPHGLAIDLGADEVRFTTIVADEAVTMTYNTQGLTTTLDIPAGALGDVAALAQAPLGDVPPAPGELYVGEGFELVGYSNASRQLEYPLVRPVTMTVQYSDAAVRTLEDESDLYLAWWAGAGWVDAGTTCNQGTSYYVRDTGPYTTTNRIVTPVCRLGRFALFGPTRYVYMPVVLREQ